MYVLSVNLVTKDGEIPAGEIVENLDAKTIKRLEETDSIREPTDSEIALYEKVQASKKKEVKSEAETDGEDGDKTPSKASAKAKGGRNKDDLA